MKKTLFFTMAVALLAACNNAEKQKAEQQKIEQEKKEQAYRDSIDAEILARAYTWDYETSEDEMTSKKVYYASVQSEDIASLDFPYEGGTTLKLFLRNKGGKNEAFIRSSNGQIIDDYNNPTISVRFDDEPPVRFSVSESSDNDPTVRFISSANKFVQKVKNSKTMKIQIEFYTNGLFVYNFKTADLKWDY